MTDPDGTSDPERGPDAESIRSRTPAWTREQAGGLARVDDAVKPVIYPPSDPVSDEVYLWDTWLLRERDGAIADVGGYRVAFALTAPRDLLPGKRHDVATIRCFYSADGESWESAGPVFEGSDPLGSRQWAGCALWDPDGEGPSDLYCYYTAAGEADEEDLSYTQHLALATGGTLVADGESRSDSNGGGETAGDGLRVEGTFTHESLLHPDGVRYETEEQSRGMIYTFRDPWFFEDPATGETHLLFEANVPVPEDSDACDGDAVGQEFNGAVGIADSPTGDPTEWELRDPLLHSTCVNQELERPHVVVRDGRYYLFVSSHEHTFAPGIDGFDALYGFVADSLHGEYRPLNDTGLVLTNPGNAPFQTYSWLAFPHEEELLVTSFFNYYDLEGRTLDQVAELPPEEQFRRFGGTLSPTIRIDLDGGRTRVLGKLAHGHIPLPSEDLPELVTRDVDAGRGGYGGSQ
ncbi:glycoside hydrolase family 68 protein [Halobaculum magnesiiphilum]|uniref:Glycoside hydrolase family 68 protein n=1 Tax=Halobaculum magnesiiphilum TaxID=1017351 RepID=A0A8T8W8Q7_9EURY|nr:glycoside hydrolase family 68 protein [Halobaculum magnesiiphilum]QZP36235.1 glycoside hydrolase family 68 protein [Halobaculum magnesiiphilum]